MPRTGGPSLLGCPFELSWTLCLFVLNRQYNSHVTCPAGVRGGLVRDLPDPINSNQRVEVDPRFRGALRAVESEEDVCDVASLSHRDDSAGDARVRRGGPSGERFANQVFV